MDDKIVFLVWKTGGWGIDEDAPEVIKVFDSEEKAEAYCKLHDGKHLATCGCHNYNYTIEIFNIE